MNFIDEILNSISGLFEAHRDVEWVDVGSGLPEGGTAGQVLTKTEDGADWQDIEALPEITASDANKVLTVTSDASGYTWIDAPGVS